MTWMHYYTITGGFCAAYVLGLMHGKEHTGWKNLVMALTTGALWPIAVCYGIYMTHFNVPNG